MTLTTVFTNNRTQAVRLPADSRFPETVKKVDVRVVGQERILAPAAAMWDSFFLQEKTVSKDFLSKRATQKQSKRESF